MDLKDEIKSLEPYMRRRIRIVAISCGVWAGVIVSTAAVFQLFKPWMDKRRLEKEALLEAKLEQGKDPELLTT
ncbi:hypothetical protein ACROYT_G034899 [Oculina patagonica]